MYPHVASQSYPATISRKITDTEPHQRLLEAIALGDEDAFQDFYTATLDKVYGVALRITGSRDAAEEVVPEVFIQVWCEADRYDPKRGKVVTWLSMITRSRALDYIHNQDRALLVPEPENLNSDYLHGDNQADNWLAVLERDSAIHAALWQLQPVQRQLVGLAFFRGFSHRQIADFTDMPLGSIKTHLRTAIKVLRQALNGED